MTQTPAQIVPQSGGPYQVTGPMEMVDADGQVIEPPTDTVYLCRCGRSATKPFLRRRARPERMDREPQVIAVSHRHLDYRRP